MTSSDRLGGALALALLLAPLCAHAQQRNAADIASARQLYNEGIELRDKGDLKGALEKFKAAHALGNTPITGLDLCRTHSALGQPVEAREACLSVARIPPMAEESERAKGARSDAARLAEAERAKIALLRIKLTGVPAGVEPTVTVDNAVVPAAALGEPRSVDPGAHTVVARIGSGPETRVAVDTREGETKDVAVAVQLPPEGPAPSQGAAPLGPTPARSATAAPSKTNWLAITSFTVAGVGGIIGTVFGLKAMSSESDLDKRCQSKICGRSDWADLDSAKSQGNVSTAFFVIAGAAAGVGIVSLVTSGSSKSTASAPASSSVSTIRVRPVIGLGGGGIDGSF
jgi:hypothetical protein